MALAFGFAVCFSRILAQAQEPIRVDVNLVMLDATVKTKSGQIMNDLKKDDFEVREDGVAKKITVFSRDQLPLNVALVLDLSDSIGPFLDPLREAATTTLGALKPEDEVALFTFSTEAQLSAPLTTDKNEIVERFRSFHTGGATNINDGIFVAAKYLLETAPKGRRVIILISDNVGTDAGGEGTKDIITEATAADAAVYNLKVPGNNPPALRFAAGLIPGLVDINKVTEQTGGEIFDVQSTASLAGGLSGTDRANQDALYPGILHLGQRRRGQTAQAGRPSGAVIWSERSQLRHPGEERLFHSLTSAL